MSAEHRHELNAAVVLITISLKTLKYLSLWKTILRKHLSIEAAVPPEPSLTRDVGHLQQDLRRFPGPPLEDRTALERYR